MSRVYTAGDLSTRGRRRESIEGFRAERASPKPRKSKMRFTPSFCGRSMQGCSDSEDRDDKQIYGTLDRLDEMKPSLVK